MVIQTNFLHQLIFQSTEELYSYLVDLLCQSIEQLKEEDFSLSKSRWKYILDNFNITEEDLDGKSAQIIYELGNSVEVYRDSQKFSLPHIWMNTLISLFFIIEPDIIEKNSGVVEQLWIKLFKYYSTRDNAITFLNIIKR